MALAEVSARGGCGNDVSKIKCCKGDEVLEKSKRERPKRQKRSLRKSKEIQERD
jgi:hypothetical protein